MSNNIKNLGVNIHDDSLTSILSEVYNETQRDIEYMDEIIELYRGNIVNSQHGAEMYGELLNDLIQNKNTARDRMVKIANIITSRLRNKIEEDESEGKDVEPGEMIKKIDEHESK